MALLLVLFYSAYKWTSWRFVCVRECKCEVNPLKNSFRSQFKLFHTSQPHRVSYWVFNFLHTKKLFSNSSLHPFFSGQQWEIMESELKGAKMYLWLFLQTENYVSKNHLWLTTSSTYSKGTESNLKPNRKPTSCSRQLIMS
jgi:hypothetical protein